MKSAPWELSNDMSHNVASELYLKILIVDKLPGTTLIGNISIIINATAIKRYFIGSAFKDEAIDICC